MILRVALAVSLFRLFALGHLSAEEGENSLQESDEEAHISCVCGYSRITTKNISVSFALRLFEEADLSSTDASVFLDQPDDVRLLYEYCESCVIATSTCNKERNCLTKEFFIRKPYEGSQLTNVCVNCSKSKDKDGFLEDYPFDDEYDSEEFTSSKSKGYAKKIYKRSVAETHIIQVKIPIGGVPSPVMQRKRRHTDRCRFPTSLMTAELDCMLYAKSVKCKQTCAHGHTLEGGKEVEMCCKKEEDRWHPHPFKECQPFVDCTVTLATGGKVRCNTPALHHGPSCCLTCHRYEDKPAWRATTHSCDINGQWQPQLPFCVYPGSGLQLVARPGQSRRGPPHKTHNEIAPPSRHRFPLRRV